MITELTIENAINSIRMAKCRSRKSTSIKILQYEFIEGRKYPKMILQTLNVENVRSELHKLGYTTELVSTNIQRTVGYSLTGELNKFVERKLSTTNLVIKW